MCKRSAACNVRAKVFDCAFCDEHDRDRGCGVSFCHDVNLSGAGSLCQHTLWWQLIEHFNIESALASLRKTRLPQRALSVEQTS